MVDDNTYKSALAEIASLKRQLAIYQSEYIEKYKNISVAELEQQLRDVTNLPFMEMLFAITVVIPELMYAAQKSQEMDSWSEEYHLTKEYPNVS